MAETMKGRRVLDGVRVIEFEAIGPVPLAAMILADMGADVVRVERPAVEPIWDDVGGDVLFRGRSRVEIDLKQQAPEALELVTCADVLLEGMRPGVMERLGLGPAECLAANPALVYGRMTGWGQFGPLARSAGHDLNYLAVTGALLAMGSADQPPPVPLNLVADYGGGAMFLVSGVLAATIAARVTGQGQVVDAAMTDGVASLTAFYHATIGSGAWREEREANLLDGAAPFYRCYACDDGKFVAVAALEPQFYGTLLDTLGLARADYPQHDRSRWADMSAALAAIFASRERDEWARTFEPLDACVSPVLSWAEAVHYPHNVARSTFVTIGGITQPAPAPRFEKTPSFIKPQRLTSVAATIDRWQTRALPAGPKQ